MARDSCKPLIWKGRRVNALVVDPSAREHRLHEAIARQAYRLFESHGASAENEADDWKQAEAEVVRPLECGLLLQNDRLSACTDIGAFGEGDIELYVEPRRLSLCGRSRAHGDGATNAEPEFLWRVLDLPVEVDPTHVHTKFNGRILEVDLYRTSFLARAA